MAEKLPIHLIHRKEVRFALTQTSLVNKRGKANNLIDILVSPQIYDGHIFPCDGLLWSTCFLFPHPTPNAILMLNMMVLEGRALGK